MKILKILFFLLITSLVFNACERDDICLEDSTPKLIIRFYDYEDPSEFKDVINLRVSIEGIDSVYTNETITVLTDSIAIPIKTTEDITKFILTISEPVLDTLADNQDNFNLTYIRADEFVSRSCGYKTLFYEIKKTLEVDSNNWIDSLVIIDSEQNILNENSAHVKIFH